MVAWTGGTSPASALRWLLLLRREWDENLRLRQTVQTHLDCCWAVLMDDSGAYLDDSERLRAVRAALGDFRGALHRQSTGGGHVEQA